MELRLSSTGGKDAQDEPTKGSLAGGCCFDFNKVCNIAPKGHHNFAVLGLLPAQAACQLTLS